MFQFFSVSHTFLTLTFYSLSPSPSVSPYLGIELCLPDWRFSMTMVASFLMVAGQLLMPGVAALCRNWPDRDDWQVLQIVIISPFVLMLPYVWWVPPFERGFSLRSEPGNSLYSTRLYYAVGSSTQRALFGRSDKALFLPLSLFLSSFCRLFPSCTDTLGLLLSLVVSKCLLLCHLHLFQDFSWVSPLVAGYPALQKVQSHDATHCQEEPGWYDNRAQRGSDRWVGRGGWGWGITDQTAATSAPTTGRLLLSFTVAGSVLLLNGLSMRAPQKPSSVWVTHTRNVHTHQTFNIYIIINCTIINHF